MLGEVLGWCLAVNGRNKEEILRSYLAQNDIMEMDTSLAARGERGGEEILRSYLALNDNIDLEIPFSCLALNDIKYQGGNLLQLTNYQI
jgi:hypothetical protein